jgi:hypothetical protein
MEELPNTGKNVAWLSETGIDPGGYQELGEGSCLVDFTLRNAWQQGITPAECWAPPLGLHCIALQV